MRASRICSRCRSFCSCAATCSAGSRTTTGRSGSPPRLSRSSPDAASALYIRARLAGRFHRFDEADALLDRALAAGHPGREVDAERAALLQATGRYLEALALRERLAKEDPGIHTLGALASLLAEMDQWAAAETSYAAALDADTGVSPLPCGQLLFEWGVSAMRRGELDRAEALFGELDAILPQHVPGRGHRAEVALARGQLDVALALITPLLDISDDPEYRATHAEILAARGERAAAASEAERAAAAYELLLARRPEAYADHAAAFFMGIGNRPQRRRRSGCDQLGASRHATLAQSSRQGAALRSGSRNERVRIIT